LETRIPARLSRAEGREFGLLVGGTFLAFGALSWWRGHQVAPTILWSLGATLVVSGLLIPGSLGPVYARWMRLAGVLSRITTPITMGAIYFGLFTPVGLARRSFGRSALVRPPGGSFWITREQTRSDLKRQY
jgi:hypothetical protein